MESFKIDGVKFKVHPVYNLYGASKSGLIAHVVQQQPNCGYKHKSGYLQYCVRKKGEKKKQKAYQAHRFIYESFNGLIPPNMVIDHINNDK